jgi:hypothetical protein
MMFSPPLRYVSRISDTLPASAGCRYSDGTKRDLHAAGWRFGNISLEFARATKGDMSRATPPVRNGESVSFVALNRNKRSLLLRHVAVVGFGHTVFVHLTGGHQRIDAIGTAVAERRAQALRPTRFDVSISASSSQPDKKK